MTDPMDWDPEKVQIGSFAHTCQNQNIMSVKAVEWRILHAVHTHANQNKKTPELSPLHIISDVYDNNTLVPRMINAINIATVSHQEDQIAFIGTQNCHSKVTPEIVAKRF